MADITTSDIREGSVEGYLACVTENEAGEIDPNSTLFLRYNERWTGMRDSDGGDLTHTHQWRTVSLVFGRRRFQREGTDQFVACETLAVDLFNDFIGRALVFLQTIDDTQMVPGHVQYSAEGFVVLIERRADHLNSEGSLVESDGVTVLLQLREHAQSSVVHVSADRLSGFLSQVQDALERLRGGETATRTVRGKRRR